MNWRVSGGRERRVSRREAEQGRKRAVELVLVGRRPQERQQGGAGYRGFTPLRALVLKCTPLSRQ